MHFTVSTFLAAYAVLSLCGHVCQAVDDPIMSPTEITDQHNNHANEQSVITWAPMPEGIPYVTGKT